jgi:hypothetical protein
MLLGLAMNPSSSDAMYQHIAGVLCNVTRLPEGRKLLLEEGANAFRSVTDMLKSKSEVKKRGRHDAQNTAFCRRDGTMDTIVGTGCDLVRYHLAFLWTGSNHAGYVNTEEFSFLHTPPSTMCWHRLRHLAGDTSIT